MYVNMYKHTLVAKSKANRERVRYVVQRQYIGKISVYIYTGIIYRIYTPVYLVHRFKYRLSTGWVDGT